jgi:hypothetical protein
MIKELLLNHVLIGALLAWMIAQSIKVPIEYLRTKKWDFALLLQPGGMPSSHSALVVGVAHGVGLAEGFDSAAFQCHDRGSGSGTPAEKRAAQRGAGAYSDGSIGGYYAGVGLRTGHLYTVALSHLTKKTAMSRLFG